MVAIAFTFFVLLVLVLLMNELRDAKNDWRDITVQYKFATFGILKGTTRAKIVKAVGEPTHISHFADGQSLAQWITKNYHIALIFEGEMCGGIAHEFIVSQDAMF